ncbi:MAG: DUF433 domain-containing protein [SAR202 cluster bacterium]|nr:DUF433 domain-containing protein [SAR202 cluster bacterium]
MEKRITVDSRIQHGRPVITGTRVPVTRVLGELASGKSVDEIMKEYVLAREDIQAAIRYAAELVELEQHHPLPTSGG